MVHRKRKKISKRRSRGSRRKFLRRVKEKERKLRRIVKRLPPHARTSKVFGFKDIPNLYPEKEEILEKMEKSRVLQLQQKELEKKLKAERRKELRELKRKELEQEAEANARLLKEEREVNEKLKVLQKFGINEKYEEQLSDVVQILDRSNILGIVLDARDPLSCWDGSLLRFLVETQNKTIERFEFAKKNALGSRLRFTPQTDDIFHVVKPLPIVILNKADLVPREALVGWRTYFEKVLDRNIPVLFTSASEGLGMEELVEVVKKLSMQMGMWGDAVLGLVGFTNVGKKTIIAQLGELEKSIDGGFKLLDFAGDLIPRKNLFHLRNRVSILRYRGAVRALRALFDRVEDKNDLVKLYSIPDFGGDYVRFLEVVKESVGNEDDGLDSVAKMVIADFAKERVSFFTKFPIVDESSDEVGKLRAFGKFLGEDLSFDYSVFRKKIDKQVLSEVKKFSEFEDIVVVLTNKDIEEPGLDLDYREIIKF